MWITWIIPIVFFGVFIYSILYSRVTLVKDKENKNEQTKKIKRIALSMFIFIFAILIIFDVTGLRNDYGAGQHVIIPTAIDSDFWGNYKVYYKTTLYESNSAEGYYMIESDRTDLVEQVRDAIKGKTEILVYYDKWVGFKGISSPTNAPITKIESLY